MSEVKIICTLGPASKNKSVLEQMLLAGMDVARLNFSHGSFTQHQRSTDLVRQLNNKFHSSIKILQDLEGYRIRLGRFKDNKTIVLKKSQVFFLTNKDILGGKNIIPFDYEGRLADIKRNQLIYIDDGNIALLVKKSTARFLKTKVIIPGILKERKGVNMPGANLKFEGLTDKDKLDINFGIKNKVDFIAQSFVRNQKDIISIRGLIKDSLPRCRIIAKIENRQGIKNIDEIIKVSDGIMIARGDMGVSIPIYEIPMVQKEIIRKCNSAGKFVITATQMLESMTENIRPTRAEVTDVANAVLDGSNYLMLSAETAVGKYPIETVKMMRQIIKFTKLNFNKE